MANAKKTKQTSAASSGRHRTHPKPGTVSYVNGYPHKLFIYQLDASKYWWVRYFAKGKTLRKSTKTENKADAINFAKQFFDDITHKVEQGVALGATSFKACAVELVKAEEAKLARDEITKVTCDNLKYRIDKLVLPHFGAMDIKSINYSVLRDYLDTLSRQEPKLSLSTISAYMGLVRKVLVDATRRNLLHHIPEFPKVGVQDTARGWFNGREYTRLWQAANRYKGRVIEVRKYKGEKGETLTQYIDTTQPVEKKFGKLMRKVSMTEDMRRLIVFMINSYIRPTDIKFMQHKHIDAVHGEYHYLRLRIPTTKKHNNPITTMPKAVEVYEKLKAFHAANGKAGADDYVFLPQYSSRDYALKQLQRQFEILLWDTKLGTGADGEERTLYSLRHTCIMYRLLYGDGINTLALARNARTSVEMIDRFYAKPLTGEMNVGMLQAKKRKRKIYDGEGESVASVT
jgi:integrase